MTAITGMPGMTGMTRMTRIPGMSSRQRTGHAMVTCEGRGGPHMSSSHACSFLCPLLSSGSVTQAIMENLSR